MRKSTEFPVWLDKPETKEKLAGKQVLMYCTGGVRCERASALLRQRMETDEEVKDLNIKGVYQVRLLCIFIIDKLEAKFYLSNRKNKYFFSYKEVLTNISRNFQAEGIGRGKIIHLIKDLPMSQPMFRMMSRWESARHVQNLGICIEVNVDAQLGKS